MRSVSGFSKMLIGMSFLCWFSFIKSQKSTILVFEMFCSWNLHCLFAKIKKTLLVLEILAISLQEKFSTKPYAMIKTLQYIRTPWGYLK